MKTKAEQKLIELLKEVPVPLVQKISDGIGEVTDTYFNKGYEQGQSVGYKRGKAEGFEEGYDKGYSAGYDYAKYEFSIESKLV